MRFRRLDLIRYGALTDKRLDFNPAADLHIVYGPNEAGKSSALSAIGDLLFGYPRATVHYSFLHDPAQLRIGAAIAAKNGEVLSFRRRRGAKNTLLADDDKETALREDALAPYLGALNRDIFKRAFGLDSRDLREGGRAMLESGGEIGTLLFSAASGLLGLRRLRQTLDDEAGQIFGPRRKQEHRFYQAVDRYENAHRAEGQLELRSGDWKRLTGEETELNARIAGLQAERQKTKTELERLRLLKKLHPLMAEIDREAAALGAFADLDGLSAEFADDLAQALALRRSAIEVRRREGEAVAQLTRETADIVVNAELLTVAAEITALFSETGAYTKARRDLPAIEREVAGYDSELAQIARRLGLADADELESRQPADADLARLKRLVETGQAMARALSDLVRQQQAEHERLTALEADSETIRLLDPKPYAERMAALAAELAALSGLDGLHVRIARAKDDLRLAARRMKPAVEDVDCLFTRALPKLSDITRIDEKLVAISQDRRAAETRIAALTAEAAEIAERLHQDERDGAVVTPDEIAGARARRDRQFAQLAGQPSTDAHAVVADLIAYADRLADAARSDADRLTRHAEARLRLTRLEKQGQEAQGALEGLEEQIAAGRAELKALFSGFGIEPLDPPAMIEWRRGVDDLARQQAAIAALEDQAALAERAAGRIRPVLEDIADAIGLAGKELPAAILAQAVARQIEVLGERWNESRSREGERKASARRIESLEARHAELSMQVEDWREHFGAACAVAGLKFDSGLDDEMRIAMAQAALDAWRHVPELLMEREKSRRRVAGMRRDITAYERRVAAIIAATDSSLANLAADAAISLLHESAIAARNANERHQALTNSLREAESRLRSAEQNLGEADERLQALSSRLPDGDHDTILARLSERTRHLERLHECRTRLEGQSEGRAEEEIRTLLAGFDPISAELEIESLAEEENRQFEKHGELVAQRSQNIRQREELETGASAEYAVFEKHAAAEEARDLARQWVVLKLASTMLAKSMEAYRERHADPVMQRAGEHFSALTGGRFSRLLQEYDERDELRLLVERQGGERLALEGLSEGTGDQLFLALRLAFLEDYAARNEPAPLIVDDVFQTFDDERTVLGLRALAATGKNFQTIVFTHQSSVVDLARRELGGAADIVTL